MSLRRVNLNLLPVLQALLREGSVSKAADTLSMSQSAASDALIKLRAALNDPLLVRVHGRMKLTPYAVDLIPSLEILCTGLEDFFSHQRFDPLTADRIFVISTSDHLVYLAGGALLAAIEREAPNISVRFIQTSDRLSDDMASRHVDFALIPSFFVDDLGLASLCFRPLLREIPVAVFRNGHPLAVRDSLSSADLEPYRILLFYPGAAAIERKWADLFMIGQHFRVAAFVPQAALPAYLLTDTDCFSILPRRLAERMAKFMPLQTRSLAFAEREMEIGLAWSPVQDSDRGHQWFRELIIRCLGAIEA